MLLVLVSLLWVGGCSLRRNPLETPIISDSQQPDLDLFNRAMNDLERSRYDVARLTLQTLINTYPDSEYIAKSKLAIADSWYREGGTQGLTQAEAEYRDFITFFPTMSESAEAQMRVSMIHYRGMEKPDRDPTHARRAEQEFQRLLLNYPNTPFIPLAEQRLRDFVIGRFGGPPRYVEQRGHPRLRMRHMPFAIDETARDRWVLLMDRALDQAELPTDVTSLLREFFHGVATFMINRSR